MIYGYIRVSTDKQTTENQRFEINKYCAQNNIKIDEWINETVSGKEAVEKRQLGKLMKILKRGDILIFSELSRLSRSMFPMFSTLHEFEINGVEVISTKENISLNKDGFGRYYIPIAGIVSEIERNIIAVRTKEALDRLRHEGVKLGRPVGSKSKRKKLTDKEEAIIRMKNENMTLNAIARKLKVSRRTLAYFLAENKKNCKK